MKYLCHSLSNCLLYLIFSDDGCYTTNRRFRRDEEEEDSEDMKIKKKEDSEDIHEVKVKYLCHSLSNCLLYLIFSDDGCHTTDRRFRRDEEEEDSEDMKIKKRRRFRRHT